MPSKRLSEWIVNTLDTALELTSKILKSLNPQKDWLRSRFGSSLLILLIMLLALIPLTVVLIGLIVSVFRSIGYMLTGLSKWLPLRLQSLTLTSLRGSLHTWLVRKCGIAKYWWEENEEVKIEEYSGLDDQTVQILMQEDAEVKIVVSYPDPSMPMEMMQPQPDPMTGLPMPMQQPMLHDVQIKRNTKDGRIRIMAVPPEELLLDRRARSFDDAGIIAHRQMATVSDLIGMGYDQDEIEENISSTDLDDQVRQAFAELGEEEKELDKKIEAYRKKNRDASVEEMAKEKLILRIIWLSCGLVIWSIYCSSQVTGISRVIEIH